MKYYYFDIETAPLEQYRNNPQANLDPITGKIISIQYQELVPETGQPIGQLNILKEWERYYSEELIVSVFKQTFIDNGVWNFIPIGNNLAFDFKFLKAKFDQYLGQQSWHLGQRPLIDLKYTLVLMNHANFKGYDSLLGKSHEARNIAGWYYAKEFGRIEDYIHWEATKTITAYQILVQKLPKIRIC